MNVEYLIILTVEVPHPGGFQQACIARTITPNPGTTRADLYLWAREQLAPSARDGATVFFSAEPNKLGGAS